MKKIAFILILLSSFIAKGQDVNLKNITIDPYLSFQNYEHFKRLTLSSPDSNAELIKGFNFEWGYTYKLKVSEVKLEPSLSDGTPFEYELVEVISKTKVKEDVQFTLFLDAKRYYNEADSGDILINNTLKQIDEQTFLYFDKVEIQVSENLIEDFKSIVKGGTRKKGIFVFVDEKTIRLIEF